MIIKFEHLTAPKHTYEYEMAHLRHQSVLEDIGDHLLSTIVAKQDVRPVMAMYYYEHPKMNTYFTQRQYNMVCNAYITRYNNLFNTNY